MKECPSCATEIPKSDEECPICQYEFPLNRPNYKAPLIVLLIVLMMYPMVKIFINFFF